MILNGQDGLKIGPLENTHVTGPIDAILGVPQSPYYGTSNEFNQFSISYVDTFQNQLLVHERIFKSRNIQD